MTSRLIKLFALASVIGLVAGCKLNLIVGEGGYVTSLSGTRECASKKYCIYEIVETNFSESFTAVPRPGYQFVRWQKGTDFLCGDSTNPTCTVTLSGYSALDSAIIALFDVMYIMPIFKDVGLDPDDDHVRNELDEDDDGDGFHDLDDVCPLNPDMQCAIDSLVVDGKEWAQLDLFVGVDWTELNAKCPAGLCSGTINGFNLTGWTWASLPQIMEMHEYYFGVLPSSSCVGVDNFFADGWRATTSPADEYIATLGYYRDPDWGYQRTSVARSKLNEDDCITLGYASGMGFIGAWFYRIP